MPSYEAEHFDPPAPVAIVTLRDEQQGILGRDTLNHLKKVLDGPQQKWWEYLP
jgi:hypothetical protein